MAYTATSSKVLVKSYIFQVLELGSKRSDVVAGSGIVVTGRSR
jgi:hypothetical protein